MKKYRRRVRGLADVFLPEYRTETPSGCWEWTGKRSTYGYGYFKKDGKVVPVHRLVLESVHGPLGKLNACHKCDNPACFRPDHLFAATQKENLKDCRDKGRAIPPPHKPGKSGVPGISAVKSRGTWRVLRYENGKQVNYGEFHDLEEAKICNAQLRPIGGDVQ